MEWQHRHTLLIQAESETLCGPDWDGGQKMEYGATGRYRSQQLLWTSSADLTSIYIFIDIIKEERTCLTAVSEKFGPFDCRLLHNTILY